MWRGRRHRRLRLAALAASAAMVAACGGTGPDDDLGYDVTADTISDETTQDIEVFAPDAHGAWPVVVAYHGNEGNAGQMALLAEGVASAGAVVFVPNYRSGDFSQQGIVNLARDAECGYRYARTVAPDYGGDLAEPVVWVGWSLGAVFALQAGLDETLDDTGKILTCFSDAPRPDIIVAVSGCYEDIGPAFDPAQWGNEDAEVILVDGDEDTVCPAAQTDRVAKELRTRHYDVRLVTIEGADHFAPVFHRYEDGQMVESPDEPAGQEVQRLVTDAVTGKVTGG